MLTTSQFSPLVPHRKLNGTQSSPQIEEQFDTLRDFQQGKARADLSQGQRQDLTTLEQDHGRLRELSSKLKAAAAWVAAGDATPEILESIGQSSQEKSQLDARKDDIVSRNRNGPGSNFNVFDSGDTTVIDFTFNQTKLSPALKSQGAESVRYEVRSYLGQDDISVAAYPQGPSLERGHYARVRVSTQEDRWRGEEYTLGDPDGFASVSYTPMSRGGKSFYAHESGELKRWSATGEALAAQVMTDLGVTWPVPVRE